MGYHSFVPVQLVIASFYLPLVLRVLLPAALLLQRREPSMQKSCGVLGWPSLIYVPSSFMQEWTSAFSEALLRLSRFPTLENWTYLFCSTKLLFAAPAHGGKQCLHTTERLLCKRFSNGISRLAVECCQQYPSGLSHRPCTSVWRICCSDV